MVGGLLRGLGIGWWLLWAVWAEAPIRGLEASPALAEVSLRGLTC